MLRMRRNNIKLSLLFLSLIGLYSGCSLQVDNKNSPDTERVLSTATGVLDKAKQNYLVYWQYLHRPNIGLTAESAADRFTASWGNFGWQASGAEPRLIWDNTVAGAASTDNVSDNFYFGMNSVLNQTNDILRKINSGVKLGADGSETSKIAALSYFIQGLVLGQLGLVYDQAVIVTENTDMDKLTTKKNLFSKYPIVIDSAIASLTKCIAMCDQHDFTIGSDIINGIALSDSILTRVCHSYIARFMVLSARTKA